MRIDRAIDFPETAYQALRFGLGLGPFFAGLDKFFNLLTDWGMYLNPWVERMLPVSAGVFMRSVGVIEMIVGLAILTRWTRLGAYVACAWLASIALSLVSAGMFLDIAVRDLEIALGAFVLARLATARAAAPARVFAPADLPASRRTSAA